MSNTILCELDKLSLEEFKRKALSHKIKYKSKIGLPRKIKFGVEIEALGDDFINKMLRKIGILYYENPELEPNNIYKRGRWILNKEHSIHLEDNSNIYPSLYADNDWISIDQYNEMITKSQGGEVVSPIFHDDIISWYRLKKILKYMKNNISNLRVNGTCATHNHFDIGIFNNDPHTLYRFMVLLAECEPILTRFYCGEYINLRESVDEYAKRFDQLFINFVPTKKDYSSYHNFLREMYSVEGLHQKEYSFDFFNVFIESGRCFNTFENRIPNGTLSPEIIQNNIMVMGHLINFIANNDYDIERGIYRINTIKDYNDIDDYSAFYVADFLPNDDLKIDFLSQYYKDLKVCHSKKLVKSKRKLY